MKVQKKGESGSSFSKTLFKWDKQNNGRLMPWKGEKDPYKIWLSEIILQQTRVEQGLKYYEKFVTVFPDVHKLANASHRQIFKLWEGLGYYTRCSNLIETATYISKDLKGEFPCKYEEIRTLKGIGPYTAAAIASFAFNESRAVLDGNVFRVLSRFFCIDKPIDSAEGKLFFYHLANKLLDKKKAGLYNQAIMDFGATVCKPVPLCGQCPFNTNCKALLTNKISSLPVKNKKTTIQRRWFNYLLFEYKGKFAIRQRNEKDIWRNLFEFLLIESGSELKKNGIIKEMKKKDWLGKNDFTITSVSPVFKQQLTHQLVEGRFIRMKLLHKPRLDNVVWITRPEMKNYAFPKFINQYLFKT
jgi:A/G-specific adenine glycosylase